MAEIVIYTSPFCSYCARAKTLLGAKGVAFQEVDVLAEPARRTEMVTRSGGRQTVPQIFVGDTHVGGFEQLYALDRAGKLDPLLGAAP